MSIGLVVDLYHSYMTSRHGQFLQNDKNGLVCELLVKQTKKDIAEVTWQADLGFIMQTVA